MAPARSARDLGIRQEIDPNLLIPDKEESLNDGALVAMEWNDARERENIIGRMLSACRQSVSY